MHAFEIIETDNGLTVAEVQPGESPEEAALRNRGLLVDAGPYPSYDVAYEALLAIDEEADEAPPG
jgi:hypothetical protein